MNIMHRSKIIKMSDDYQITEADMLRKLKLGRKDLHIMIIDDTDKQAYSLEFIKMVREELGFSYTDLRK